MPTLRPPAQRSQADIVRGPQDAALSWRGRGALLLGGLHVVLLAFPPIPPVTKGSVWSHALAFAVIVLGGLELHRSGDRLVRWWGQYQPRTRAGLTAAALLWLLVFGLGMRIVAPALFARWSGEEGVWEPLSVLLYLTGAVALLAVARPADGPERRHFRLVGTGFILLALEEVDYFGIIGGMVGRIDGVYAGSPHDLIRLWAQGVVGAGATMVVIAVGVALAAALMYAGYLQPRRIARMLASPAALWLVPAAALLGLAAVDDAGIWYLSDAGHTPEELLELGGALCLLAFGMETGISAARATPMPTAPAGGASATGALRSTGSHVSSRQAPGSAARR